MRLDPQESMELQDTPEPRDLLDLKVLRAQMGLLDQPDLLELTVGPDLLDRRE